MVQEAPEFTKVVAEPPVAVPVVGATGVGTLKLLATVYGLPFTTMFCCGTVSVVVPIPEGAPLDFAI